MTQRAFEIIWSDDEMPQKMPATTIVVANDIRAAIDLLIAREGTYRLGSSLARPRHRQFDP